MLGMNLPDNDDWTTAILTNPEVLAVDQDPLGRPARRMFGVQPSAEVWVRELSGGNYAVGLFNRTARPSPPAVTGKKKVFPPFPKSAICGCEKIFPGRKLFPRKFRRTAVCYCV